MARHPWFKFFAADHLAEPSLKMVSMAARGLWFEMLCLMDRANPRGYLLSVAGNPLTEPQLCAIIGIQVQELSALMAELQRENVFSTDATGIYCRRMVRDSALNEIRSGAGKKGGRSRFAKANAQAKPQAKSSVLLKQDAQAKPEYAYASASECASESGNGNGRVRAKPPGTNIPPTLAECVEYGATIGMDSQASEYCWNWWESAGWRRKSGPVKNWMRTMDVWSKSPFGNAVHDRNAHPAKPPASDPIMDAWFAQKD